MRLLVLGATGRIGRLVVERAAEDGHAVRVLARDAARVPPRVGVEVLEGNPGNSLDAAAAVRGVDAVIAALGPRRNTLRDELAIEAAMGHLVAGMALHEVRRIVTLSGAGVTIAGDRKPLPDRIMSRLVGVFAGHVLGAKQREYEVVAASDLDWTALRPPLVTDGEPRGYRLDTALRPGARVTRADVAAALVDQVEDRAWIRRAPFVLPAATRSTSRS